MSNTIKNGTAVALILGNTTIRATLNESTTAKDLLSKLPYKVTLNRYEFDYCGVMQKSLAFDEADKHNGWENGDICLAGSYFTILFDGEEHSASHSGLIRIGKVEEGDLSKVKSLASEVELTVSLA
ncbi:cyclophilin-like fold protein [Chondrinema litorale]|uniref:cyclophilin-like fold protein n=1 Tax=Chondrinema litorale TaxID=2994555 RepID=UPI002542E7DD|nr:cyclophilin-like fold protein [Chondrinema litorale]UZR96820.1 cyclophilin-like fold protein [Chondrinema litorale]